MTVRIYIDRLLLEGFTFSAGQANQVQAAVERELSHLISMSSADNAANGSHLRARELQASLGARSAAVPSATPGPFNPPQNSTPSQLGRHIAQSIHGGIRNSNDGTSNPNSNSTRNTK